MFTTEELEQARRLIEGGYKHRVRVQGSTRFRQNVKEALGLMKTAKYYNFFRTYIRKIVEINGLSQLRETDALLWVNADVVAEPLEAACFFVQKAEQMKRYVEGKLYYGGIEEARAVQKCVDFLNELKTRSRRKEIRDRVDRSLRLFTDSVFL